MITAANSLCVECASGHLISMVKKLLDVDLINCTIAYTGGRDW